MLRIVKVGGLAVGLGVLAGVGVIGWMRLHSPEAAVVSSKGGSVLLDTATPAPEAKDSTDLRVAGPESVAAAGGGAGSLMGGGGSSGGSKPLGSTPAPGSGLPTPDKFEEYNQYRDSPGALFGDVVVGRGAEVVAGSNLLVHYRGWLTDGRLFDETYSRGNPFSFREGDHGVIPGWEQGFLGMKAGGKRRLIVPPAAGYGVAGHDPIPPNAVLVFDVELVAVQ